MFDALHGDLSAALALQQSAAFARALDGAGVPYTWLPDDTLMLERRLGPLRAQMIIRPRFVQLDAVLNNTAIKGPVIIAPDQTLPLQRIGAVPLVSPSVLAVVDLRPEEDQLRARLNPKWRNRLRHAERQRLRVARQNMPMDPTHWLLDADEIQQQQRRYRGWPRALTLAFARENPGAAKLFTAFWGREPVAAMLILRHAATATYHIGHSRASGRIVSAHNLLMWSAMLWAKSKGLERFELGTLNTEDAPGLARFKLGTGARPHTLGGTWLLWRPLRPFARPLFALDRKLMQP